MATKRVRSLRRIARSMRALPVAYGQARAVFRSGDLIAQSHGDWQSWAGVQTLAVRVFTGSTYSHVGVIEVDPTDGHVYVIEAVRPCSHRVRLSAIGSFYHINLGVFADWTPRTRAYAASVVGVPYIRWDALRAYFVPLPAGKLTECAALVREVMQRASIDLGDFSRPDTVVQRALAMGCVLTYIANDQPQGS